MSVGRSTRSMILLAQMPRHRLDDPRANRSWASAVYCVAHRDGTLIRCRNNRLNRSNRKHRRRAQITSTTAPWRWAPTALQRKRHLKSRQRSLVVLSVGPASSDVSGARHCHLLTDPHRTPCGLPQRSKHLFRPRRCLTQLPRLVGASRRQAVLRSTLTPAVAVSLRQAP